MKVNFLGETIEGANHIEVENEIKFDDTDGLSDGEIDRLISERYAKWLSSNGYQPLTNSERGWEILDEVDEIGLLTLPFSD
jgi:hypothetical protein